jgi:hypothetical protein
MRLCARTAINPGAKVYPDLHPRSSTHDGCSVHPSWPLASSFAEKRMTEKLCLLSEACSTMRQSQTCSRSFGIRGATPRSQLSSKRSRRFALKLPTGPSRFARRNSSSCPDRNRNILRRIIANVPTVTPKPVVGKNRGGHRGSKPATFPRMSLRRSRVPAVWPR